MPVHLAAGDQDEFQAEYHAAVLHKLWRDRRWPAELRVAAGGHDYGLWREAAREALLFALRRVRRPEPADAGEAAAEGRS